MNSKPVQNQLLQNAQTTPPPGKRKLLVFSTSITKGIDVQRFNTCFGDGTARFQKWHGGRAQYMKHYAIPHVKQEKPDMVILQGGGNDLSSDTPTTDIANDLIEIALTSKNNGVSEIFVGGVPIRADTSLEKRRFQLNETLMGLCNFHGFTFIDHSKITTNDLLDGVHLNRDGTRILADDYLDALRTTFNGIQDVRTGYAR